MEKKEVKDLIQQVVDETLLMVQPEGWGSNVQPPWQLYNDGVKELEYRLLKALVH